MPKKKKPKHYPAPPMDCRVKPEDFLVPAVEAGIYCRGNDAGHVGPPPRGRLSGVDIVIRKSALNPFTEETLAWHGKNIDEAIAFMEKYGRERAS